MAASASSRPAKPWQQCRRSILRGSFVSRRRGADILPASSTPFTSSEGNSVSLATRAIQRVHVSDLTPLEFDKTYRSAGKPVIISGAIGDTSKYSLSAFADLLGSFPLTCRIHGTDGYATKPHLWSNSSSHARHTVPTDGLKFKRAIETGFASQQVMAVSFVEC
eukprot:6198250-Pleurochrysis_carterae.AAC.5